MSIEVTPWPCYSESGDGPYWNLRVEVPRFTGSISYAAQTGRFVESAELARLRRSSPRALYCAGVIAAGALLKAVA
jgi:hypothetical protein